MASQSTELELSNQRRSTRQRGAPQRFEPQGRRQAQRPIPYHARRRQRNRQQQQQQQQQEAQQQQQQENQEEGRQVDIVDAVGSDRIIADFSKWSKANKFGNKTRFMNSITDQISFFILSLFYGCPCEFSKLFTSDPENFRIWNHRLSSLHQKNFPFSPVERQVLCPYTSSKINPERNDFLFRYSVIPEANSVPVFCQNFFESRFLTPEFILLLSFYCNNIAHILPRDFVTCTVESLFSKAEIQAAKAMYFCWRCCMMYEKESVFLSHIMSRHKTSLMTEDPIENDDEMLRDRQHLLNESHLPFKTSWQNAISDEDIRRHFSSFRTVELVPFAPGFPVQARLRLGPYGYFWNNDFIGNDPNQFRPNGPEWT
jgi:hypothetical protein